MGIVLDHEGTLKIIDLDKAATEQECETETELMGTEGYMAPEIIQGEVDRAKLGFNYETRSQVAKPKYSKASDIWSIGCIMFQMLTRKNRCPFGVDYLNPNDPKKYYMDLYKNMHDRHFK